MQIHLHPVQQADDFRRYAAFVFRLYQGHPYWVPPLWGQALGAIDPSRNPLWQGIQHQSWLALHQGETVGRLTVLINPAESQHLGEVHARFGWADFVDDPAVSGRLLAAAEAWARQRAAVLLKGPHGITSLDANGGLVSGFQTLGSFTTSYNEAYFPQHLEAAGYRKRVDWIEHRLQLPAQLPARVRRLREMLPKRYGLRYQHLRRRAELRQLAPAVLALFTESYQPLTGWVPLTETQKAHYLQHYFRYLRPDLVGLVVDKQGDIQAFGIMMPSLTEALQRIRGSLWPTGWYHLMQARQHATCAELVLIGARPAWQDKGLPALLFAEGYQVMRQAGIQQIRVHPMLEHNQAVLGLFKDYDMEPYRRRRVWEKRL